MDPVDGRPSSYLAAESSSVRWRGEAETPRRAKAGQCADRVAEFEQRIRCKTRLGALLVARGEEML